MLLLVLAACTVFQPVDGTWLFSFEPESVASGDCADDSGGGGGAVATGDTHMWVDGYTLSGSEVAFQIGGTFLVGTLTGGDLEVSYERGYHRGDVSENYNTVLEGTLAGGTMEGSYSSTNTSKNDGDTYTCTDTLGFTAARSVSDPNTYATH